MEKVKTYIRYNYQKLIILFFKIEFFYWGIYGTIFLGNRIVPVPKVIDFINNWSHYHLFLHLFLFMFLVSFPIAIIITDNNDSIE